MIDLHKLQTQKLGSIVTDGFEHKIEHVDNCPVTEPWWAMVGRIFLNCIAESDSEYVRGTILYPTCGPWVTGHVFMGMDRGTENITNLIPEAIREAHYITEVYAKSITFRYTSISKTALKWFELESFEGWLVSKVVTEEYREPDEVEEFLIDFADAGLEGIEKIIKHTLQHAGRNQ